MYQMKSLLVKISVIGGLMLTLLIPLTMVNSIIEERQDRKNELLTEGIDFSSETDTEVIVQMIELFANSASGNDLTEAVRLTVQRLRGAGGNVVGVVLNRREYSIPGWLYGRL